MQGGITGMAKCLDIQNLIFKEKLDILCLNETNLKSDIDTSSLDLPINYTFLRKDRITDNGHGGCGILISNRIKYKLIDVNKDLTLPTTNIEALWIYLEAPNVFICCFYRSEQFCPVDSFLDYMTECMMKIGHRKIIWYGDINIDQNDIKSINYRKLDITMKMFGMVQTVQQHTRIAQLGNKITRSTIDVVMTNAYSDFISCVVLDDQIGDHQAVKIMLDFNVPKASKFYKILIRDHCKRNVAALSNFLANCCDYDPILNSSDVNAAAQGLNYHIETYYDRFCPIKQIKCHSDYIHNPSDELLANIKLRRKLHRKFRKHNIKKHPTDQPLCLKCNMLQEAFRKQKNLTTKLARNNRSNNVMTELQAKCAKNDLKGVWRTIKKASNLPVKATNANGNLNVDTANDFFTNVGAKIQEEVKLDSDPKKFRAYLPDISNINPKPCLSHFDPVSENEVTNYIKSIPIDKSISDIVPLKIIRQILPSIIKPLTHIINLSLSTGTMPNLCKIAVVTPIHKEGNPADPGNYRPISILPILGKTVEFFVNNQLTQYLDEKGLISKNQYGFRKDHSTTYLMLDLFDEIYTSKSKHKHPAIVFLDIKKAFDTVSHKILLEKLRHYGIEGIALRWFESFLSDRMQKTKIGNKISQLNRITSGVPQGSILGPALFCIFINDLPMACKNSTPYLFADDGALYFENVNRKDYLNIKQEMISVFAWLQANGLALNNQKTRFIVFDSNPVEDALLVPVRNDLTLVICECKSQKYLGLIVDNKLTFYDHIEYIKKKVSKRIGALYRSKSLLPLKFRKMFANALMLPQFDYLDIIWCKTSQYKLKELDILYKKVAKIALDVSIRESSIEVYKNMAWLPLHLRRQLHLTTYMYRIVNEFCPQHFIGKFTYISGGSRDGNNCNLYTKKCKSHKEFYYLGAKAWNILSQSLRSCESVKSFSYTYKKALLENFINDEHYHINNCFDKFYSVHINPV